MKSFEHKTLAQIVTDKPATISLFEKFNLDHYCRGKQTLYEACNFPDNKYDALMNELSLIYDNTISVNSILDADRMRLSELIDLILSKPNSYANEELPGIRHHLQKRENKYGLHHPNSSDILQQFDQSILAFVCG